MGGDDVQQVISDALIPAGTPELKEAPLGHKAEGVFHLGSNSS